MFFFKKLVTPLLFPHNIAFFLIFLGTALLFTKKRHRTGKAVLAVGLGVMVTFSNVFVAEALMRPLERKFVPLAVTDASPLAGVRWIVVLGGGHVPDSVLPAAGNLSNPSRARIVEAVRLYRLTPGARLLCMGGGRDAAHSDGGYLAETAKSLGVAAADIVAETESPDTESQAEVAGKYLGTDRFVLVTSASHMPRSVGLFVKRGLSPIPAPTDYQVHHDGGGIAATDFFPSLRALALSQQAVYEYAGMLWAKMRGLA